MYVLTSGKTVSRNIYLLNDVCMKWIISLLLLPAIADGQTFTILSGNNFVYTNMYQFSSIVVYKENILLPAEKCDSLITLDLQGNYLYGRKLNIVNAQLEGVSLYNDHLLLLDETVNNARVIFYDLEKGQTNCEVKLNTSYKTDDEGLEGIAVNASGNICYILQERDNNNKSIVRQYDIVTGKKEAYDLRYKSGMDITIVHPALPAQLKKRYSDLYFKDNCLHLLGSYFRAGDPSNQYFIDTIAVTRSDGYLSPGTIRDPENHVHTDLSRKVRAFLQSGIGGKRFCVNLEGLTMYGNEIYLVSDNAASSGRDCSLPSNEITLLVKFRPPAFVAGGN
jgi:hypothetical protein